MSRLGGMMVGNSRRRPYVFGGTTSGMRSLKEVGSANANPGSLAIQIPPGSAGAVSSSFSLPERTNFSDVVGSTVQNHPQKYKYKYKYPGDKKRKREGDFQPVDKKLRFQNEEDKVPGIEPRSVPGDQYAEGASVNTEKVKQRYRDEVAKAAAETAAYKNEKEQWDTAKVLSKGKAILKTLDMLGAEKLIPPGYKEVYDITSSMINELTSQHTILAATSSAFNYAEATAREWAKYVNNGWTEGSRAAYEAMMKHFEDIEKEQAKIPKRNEAPGSAIVQPKGMGKGPGESSVPEANVISVDAGVTAGPRDTTGQGDEPLQAYGGEEQKATPGGDPNRTNPITPATGSRQTAATANSLISVKKLKAAAERTSRELGPEAVHGNARERANMGKGALDTYEFQGPFDYPIYPGGRPDDTLTMMGAWRTDGGNDSSLWYSKKTAKGANAKRNKYFKWTAKGGGRWRKLSKDDMVNVIQKGGQSDNRFYGTRTNLKFAEFQRNRDRNVALGRIGNAKVVESEHGNFSRGRNKYVGANKVGIPTDEDVPAPYSIGEEVQEPKEGPGENKVGTEQHPPVIQDVHWPSEGGSYDLFLSDLKSSLGLVGYHSTSQPMIDEYYNKFMNQKRKREVSNVPEFLEKMKKKV